MKHASGIIFYISMQAYTLELFLSVSLKVHYILFTCLFHVADTHLMGMGVYMEYILAFSSNFFYP